MLVKISKIKKTENFEIGERIEAKVNLFNNITGKMLLSIKDIESDGQESYTDEVSGSSLGNILGEALQESRFAEGKDNSGDDNKDNS